MRPHDIVMVSSQQFSQELRPDIFECNEHILNLASDRNFQGEIVDFEFLENGSDCMYLVAYFSFLLASVLLGFAIWVHTSIEACSPLIVIVIWELFRLFAGYGVLLKGWKVAYTRFLTQIMLIACTQCILYGKTMLRVYSIWYLCYFFFVSILPMVKRWRLLHVLFVSFERPEDRPNTVLWILLQLAGIFGVQIALQTWLYPLIQTMKELKWIVICSHIGDALAEPVGRYVGGPVYPVWHMCGTSRRYFRTVSGSLMVWFLSVAGVYFCRHTFTGIQFSALAIVYPIFITFVEAMSPHTLDGPAIAMMSMTLPALVLHLTDLKE